MGKFISLGQYNQLYKYIWIYLSIRFITIFIFERDFVFEQIKVEIIGMPSSPFISCQIEYLSIFLISLIIKLIQMLLTKNVSTKSIVKKKLIFNKIKIEKEYGITSADYFLYVNMFLLVVLELGYMIIDSFQCTILDYWVSDMLFLELFNSRLFNTKIYKHQIISLIFILSSFSLIQSIYIIISFSYDTDEIKIFDGRKWLIPSGLTIYLFLSFSVGYIHCNEKYYLEKKYISVTDYIFYYAIIGIILTLICSIISTLAPCGDNTLPELTKIFCSYIDEDEDNNEIYYFENYKLYFKELAKENLGLKIFFIILYCLFYYSSTYYCYEIFKRLNPLYHICMYQLVNLVINILAFINDLVNEKMQGVELTLTVLYILILIFYFLGGLVYLEFIELNFCNLNYHLKRNIKERAKTDIMISLTTIDCEKDEENWKN